VVEEERGVESSSAPAAAYVPATQTDCVVDLSHDNEVPDPAAAFAAARESGVEMVILKATQGTDFVDPTFAARSAAALDAGLLVGAYHFCDGTDPAAQARFFLETVGDLAGRIVLCLDAERNESSQVTVAGVESVAAAVREALGRPLDALYMGRAGPDGTGDGLPSDALSALDLWLPEYGDDPVPPPGFSRWVMHQYTGDGVNGTGEVAGIGSGLDRSLFAGSAEDLRAWHAAKLAAGDTPSPAPPTSPPPAPAWPPSRVLRYADPPMTGDDVRAAQGMLGVRVDGVFGRLTQAATRAFQARSGIRVDGEIGPQTAAHLAAPSAAGGTAR
jgi:lysozyme